MADDNVHPHGTLAPFGRESADPHLREKLIEHFINLSGTFAQESSPAGIAKAIGTAALSLTGARRAAVCRCADDGSTVCLWSHGFTAAQAERAATAVGIESGPVLLADQALWPLIRGGRTIGLVVCGFSAPREWSASEIEVASALALHGAAALERALRSEAPGGRAEAESHNTRISEALRLMQAEGAQLVETQRELEAQHARLIRTRRTLGAVNVWMLALRQDLKAELARLAAEQARVLKALEDAASEDRRLDAARETLGPQLDAADQALDRAGALTAVVRAQLDTRAPQPDPRPTPSADDVRLANAKRLSEAEHAKLLEALGLGGMPPAETQEVQEPEAEAEVPPPVPPAAEPEPEPPVPDEGPSNGEPEFSYELGGPLPASRTLDDLYPMLVERAAELLHANGRPLTVEQRLAILGRALDDRDGHRAGYGERLAAWAEAVAGMLGCTGEEIADIRCAALLHDLGKVAVPEAILRTADQLTDANRSVVRVEPIVAEQILRPVKGMEGVAVILRHRYERWDGKGYPDGLQGNHIPFGARILAVVDAFGAMTTVRRYRTMVYSLDAVVELRQCAGTQFDPRVVEAFCSVLKREQ